MINSDREIDCIGLFCPMPIVKTREAMGEMALGQVLKMLADDPASEADMRIWARRSGNELLEVSRRDGIFCFFVRKAR
jgi:TusA-related sulfurtransferase